MTDKPETVEDVLRDMLGIGVVMYPSTLSVFADRIEALWKEREARSDYERFRDSSPENAALLLTAEKQLDDEREKEYSNTIARLRATMRDVAEILARRIPLKERGPWKHSFGCPAETNDTDNAACTCGSWAQIDADLAALTRLREEAEK